MSHMEMGRSGLSVFPCCGTILFIHSYIILFMQSFISVSASEFGYIWDNSPAHHRAK